MSTLLLRLAAPLQSWGVDAKFERRGTARTPTKSGVLGLVAAALGIRRNDFEELDRLRSLHFGVRIDKEGVLLRDYHTAKSQKDSYVTNRYYLSDAVFLAALEGDEELLHEIDYALHNPVFPLFLGRRACPPEGRVSLGIRSDKSLLDALNEEPWQVSDWQRKKNQSGDRFNLVVDARAQDEEIYYQRDLPLSFDQTHRRFGFRLVTEKRRLCDVPDTVDP
jgi:CRISPR system Cascade subunit CasD